MVKEFVDLVVCKFCGAELSKGKRASRGIKSFVAYPHPPDNCPVIEARRSYTKTVARGNGGKHKMLHETWLLDSPMRRKLKVE